MTIAAAALNINDKIKDLNTQIQNKSDQIKNLNDNVEWKFSQPSSQVPGGNGAPKDQVQDKPGNSIKTRMEAAVGRSVTQF